MQKKGDDWKMFSLAKKAQAAPAFTIDRPKLSIGPDPRKMKSALKDAGVAYKSVTDGYLTFAGTAFGHDIPLMFGIHYNKLRVEYIEIFRPPEFCATGTYDLDASFRELSGVLREAYGEPLATASAAAGSAPCEQWRTSGYIVKHFIADRFGSEEHLHISFDWE